MKTLADMLAAHPTPWKVVSEPYQRTEGSMIWIKDANGGEVDVTGDSDDDARLGAYVEAVNAMGDRRPHLLCGGYR